MGYEAIIGEGGSLTHLFGGTELEIAKQKRDAGVDSLNDLKILREDFEARLDAAKAKHKIPSATDTSKPAERDPLLNFWFPD